MKVRCPQCRAVNQIPQDLTGGKSARTTCGACGAQILIRRDSGELLSPERSFQPQGQTTLPPAGSGTGPGVGTAHPGDRGDQPVSSMSTPYPRHRDTLIFAAVGVIMIVILSVGYVVLGGEKWPARPFLQNPIVSLLRLLNGAGPYDACESFVHRNGDLFQSLGERIELSLLRQHVRTVNGRKTAGILLKARGTKDRGEVYFQLHKVDDTWRVMSVAMKTARGDYQILHPKGKPPPEDKI